MSLDKRFLREVIGKCIIALGQSPEKYANGRLVAAHQLAEGMTVIIRQNPGNQIVVAQRHEIVDEKWKGSVTRWGAWDRFSQRGNLEEVLSRRNRG